MSLILLSFFPQPGLAWQAALKKFKLKIDLFTDIDILLMIEKYIRGEICHAIYQYAESNNMWRKKFDKNKKSLYL